MNHYRQKNPDHPSMRKTRTRPAMGGGVVASEAGDEDVGAGEPVSMNEFARQSRMDREQRLHGRDVKKRTKSRG